MQSLLAIGDTHFPYTDSAGIASIIAYIKRHRPTYVVQMGDLYDQYGFSKYPRNHNHDTPKSELERGHDAASKMWTAIHKHSPGSKCYQLLGNHDVRATKRVAERVPEMADYVSLRHLYTFPGVDTQTSDRSVLELTVNDERIALHHGWLSKPGDHVRFFGRSCIIGHSHSPHVLFDRRYGATHFELNAGYVGDPLSHVFSYGATMHRWTRAFGVVDSDGPRVVRLEK